MTTSGNAGEATKERQRRRYSRGPSKFPAYYHELAPPAVAYVELAPAPESQLGQWAFNGFPLSTLWAWDNEGRGESNGYIFLAAGGVLLASLNGRSAGPWTRGTWDSDDPRGLAASFGNWRHILALTPARPWMAARFKVTARFHLESGRAGNRKLRTAGFALPLPPHWPALPSLPFYEGVAARSAGPSLGNSAGVAPSAGQGGQGPDSASGAARGADSAGSAQQDLLAVGSLTPQDPLCPAVGSRTPQDMLPSTKRPRLA